MSTIAELRKADGRTPRRLCPRCREESTEMVLEVKVRERIGGGRSGTQATKSLTLCEVCAVALFERFVEELKV